MSIQGFPADSSGGEGTVTSVDLSMPSQFSVSGNPVTNDGTLTVSLVTQASGKFWAGPASGSPATPTFRSIVADDLPPGGSGTVTSVDMSVPDILSVSGNPVTTSGTLDISLVNQSSGMVFAGPASGNSDAPTFRYLSVSEVSNALNKTGDTVTGTLYFTANINMSNTNYINDYPNQSYPAAEGNVINAKYITDALATIVTPTPETPLSTLLGGTGTSIGGTSDGYILGGSTSTGTYVNVSLQSNDNSISVTPNIASEYISITCPGACIGGTATLDAGTATISDARITSSTLIVVTQSSGVPSLETYGVVAGEGSAVIYSNNGGSTVTVNWLGILAPV